MLLSVELDYRSLIDILSYCDKACCIGWACWMHCLGGFCFSWMMTLCEARRLKTCELVFSASGAVVVGPLPRSLFFFK